MLIIEGADLVGKTTMVQAVTERLHEAGLPHVPLHMTRPSPSFDYYRNYLDLVSRHTVWDRFHLSGLVYRSLDDYPYTGSPEAFSLVEAKIRQVGGMSVILYTDAQTILDRFKTHAKREMYDVERILSVNDAFIEMGYHTAITVRGKEYQYDVRGCDVYGLGMSGVDFNSVANQITDRYLDRYHQHDQL